MEVVEGLDVLVARGGTAPVRLAWLRYAKVSAVPPSYTRESERALRVTVDWVQGLELYVPVHRFEVLIKRRKGERLLHLDWHPSITHGAIVCRRESGAAVSAEAEHSVSGRTVISRPAQAPSPGSDPGKELLIDGSVLSLRGYF